MKITPSKRIAPKWLPYVCAGLYVVVFILILVAIFTKTWQYCIVIPFIVAILIVIDNSLSWYTDAKLYEERGRLIYDVNSVLDMMGHTLSHYEIKSISHVNFRKTGKTIITGDCTLKEPCKKTRPVKKVVILDSSHEVEQLILKFENKGVK